MAPLSPPVPETGGVTFPGTPPAPDTPPRAGFPEPRPAAAPGDPALPREPPGQALAGPTGLVPAWSVSLAQYQAYASDWRAFGEAIIPEAFRLGDKDFAAWRLFAERCADPAACPPGLGPAESWFLCEPGGGLLGGLVLRRVLSPWMERFGGHVGYGVRPGARRRGHARTLLGFALERWFAASSAPLQLACKESNQASRRLIESFGGRPERTVRDGSLVKLIYLIPGPPARPL